MPRTCVASAPGKVILLGEHWVVSGSYGLAASISLRASVECKEISCSRPEVRIASSLGSVIIDVGEPEKCSGPLCGLGYAARHLARVLGIEPLCVQCRVASQIPVGAGLGSSAAVAVAFSAAYAGVYGVELDGSLVNEAAYAAEEYNHGRPSGIDNTVASYGGFVLYKRGLGVRPLESRVELDALVVNTRIQRSTRKAVEHFQRNLSMLEGVRDELIGLVDKLVLKGVELLEKRAVERFGRIMFLFHGLLSGMGVSIPELDWIVHTASDHGAYGAKLTGAGMGGSAIVIGSGNTLYTIERECRKRGFEVYRVRLGVEGVKLECK